MKSPFLSALVLILIAAIAGAYFYRSLFQSVAQYPASPTNSALQLINRLERIKIDRNFFDNPDYSDLKTYPQESLDGIEKGRTNPFVGKVKSLILDANKKPVTDKTPPGKQAGGGGGTLPPEPVIEP